MEPLVDMADEPEHGDDGSEHVPVAQRSPGPAARALRPRTHPRSALRAPSRVLVVDSADAEAYAEIDVAVADAEDGDRVIVRPGTYRVPVVVDRAIELVGDGPRDAIILEPAGAEALSLCVSGAVVRNLTIRPAAVGNDGTTFSAVWVRDVVATIEDCDLSSHLGATVWVGGRSSRATIRRCRILDGAQNGVAAWDEGTVLVEDCDISGNRWPGVMAQGPHSSATVRESRIVDNLDIGVVAQDGASLVVERSRVNRNGQGGIHLGAAAPSSRIEANDVEENGGPGVLIDEGVGVSVSGNRLRRNGLGIVASDGASPRVADNAIAESLGPSILATGMRTDPTVLDNLIDAPRAAAIVVSGGAAGQFERNRVNAERQPGAWIQKAGSWPTFLDNVISGSDVIAIACTGGASGTFERNDLRGNKGGAWDLEGAGPVELRDNLEDPKPPPGWTAAAGYVN